MFIVQYKKKEKLWLDEVKKDNLKEAKKYIEDEVSKSDITAENFRLVEETARCKTKVIWEELLPVADTIDNENDNKDKENGKVVNVNTEDLYEDSNKKYSYQEEDGQSSQVDNVSHDVKLSRTVNVCKKDKCINYEDGECKAFADINDPILDKNGQCSGFKPKKFKGIDMSKKVGSFTYEELLQALIEMGKRLDKDILDITTGDVGISDKTPPLKYYYVAKEFDGFVNAKKLAVEMQAKKEKKGD